VGGGFKINFVFELGFYNTLHLLFLLYYPWSFQEGLGIDGKVKNGL